MYSGDGGAEMISGKYFLIFIFNNF